jgi:hypothetical protein
MTTNTNGKAFAPLIALNNRGVDFFTDHGDYVSARHCFKAAIDMLERILKEKRCIPGRTITGNPRAGKEEASPAKASKGNGTMGSQFSMDTTMGKNTEIPEERATARSTSESTTTDGTSSTSAMTCVRAEEITPPSPNRNAAPRDASHIQQATVSRPPPPPAQQVTQDVAPERQQSDTPLFISKRPAMLEAGIFATDNIRCSIATIVVSFNLALSYHMLSFTYADSAEKAVRWQRTALSFYEVAFALRQKSETRRRQGSTRRAGGFMVPLLDLSILNNIGVLYRQRGNTERAGLFFKRLQSRLQSLDSTLVKDAGGFVRNLITIGLDNVSPPAASA